MSTAQKTGINPPANGRPKDVTRLFHDGGPYIGWAEESGDNKRFFVPNVKTVVTAYTSNGGTKKELVGFFRTATKVIARENPGWNVAFPGSYQAGKGWAESYRRKEPRRFTTAATMIVGLELAVKSLKMRINVYDYLRIIPAFYFVDEFDVAKLATIQEAFAAMTPAEKLAKFGADADGKTFFQICYAAFGQTDDGSVVTGLAKGHIATHFVCEELASLINTHFPAPCRVGVVKGAGEDGSDGVLGTKDLANGLKVPAVLPLADLRPCY
jgi:hypothetical protein